MGWAAAAASELTAAARPLLRWWSPGPGRPNTADAGSVRPQTLWRRRCSPPTPAHQPAAAAAGRCQACSPLRVCSSFPLKRVCEERVALLSPPPRRYTTLILIFTGVHLSNTIACGSGHAHAHTHVDICCCKASASVLFVWSHGAVALFNAEPTPTPRLCAHRRICTMHDQHVGAVLAT